MTGVEDGVEVVVAHRERATLRVGDTFLKVEPDPALTDREVAAMGLAPVPTTAVLWRRTPVLAIAAVRGTALGVLGEPSPASSAAWVATGAAIRTLHDAPLPPWPAKDLDGMRERMERESAWLATSGLLAADLVERNRCAAEVALQPRPPVFAHGDLQITHVFVVGDQVTGIIDWSEGGPGDALFDLATLTLGHEERLAEVVVGYGDDVDVDVVRGWWAWRSLVASRWLLEHGFDPDTPGAELDVLRAVR